MAETGLCPPKIGFSPTKQPSKQPRGKKAQKSYVDQIHSLEGEKLRRDPFIRQICSIFQCNGVLAQLERCRQITLINIGLGLNIHLEDHHIYIFISSSSLELLLRNVNSLGGWRWMGTTSEECFVFQLLIPFPIHLQQASRTLFSSSSDKDEFWEISSEAKGWRKRQKRKWRKKRGEMGRYW